MKTRLHGLLILTLLVLPSPGCLDETGDGSWRNPPRYGHGGTESNRNGQPDAPDQRNNRNNRFGYSGDDTGAPPADNGSPAPRERERENGTKPETATNDKPAVEKPKGPPAVSEMPFAKGVPGKPLSVKLPGYESLGEISIEQLNGSGQPTGKPQPPGTPVSIVDPNNPGKVIYFRVP